MERDSGAEHKRENPHHHNETDDGSENDGDDYGRRADDVRVRVWDGDHCCVAPRVVVFQCVGGRDGSGDDVENARCVFGQVAQRQSCCWRHCESLDGADGKVDGLKVSVLRIWLTSGDIGVVVGRVRGNRNPEQQGPSGASPRSTLMLASSDYSRIVGEFKDVGGVESRWKVGARHRNKEINKALFARQISVTQLRVLSMLSDGGVT